MIDMRDAVCMEYFLLSWLSVTRYHLSRGSGHSFRVRAGRGRRVRLALSPSAGMRVRPWPSRCRRSSPQRRSRPEPHRRHAGRVHCSAPGRGGDGLHVRRRPSRSDGHAPPCMPPSPRAADRRFRAAVRLSLVTIAQVPMRSDDIVLVSAGARGNAQNARRCPLLRSPTCLLAARPAYDRADANSTVSTSEEEEDIAMFELK